MHLRAFLSSLFFASACLAEDTGIGVSSFGAWRVGQITKADNPHMRTVPFVRRWFELEPSNGNYRFAEEFDELIAGADAQDLFVSFLIYVGPDSPEWVFDVAGEVLTDHSISRFPNYFHPFYEAQLHELIDEFGAYLRALPHHLQDRIVFVFGAEGATADGAPYKGNLLPGYGDFAITKEQWNVFRIATWQAYKVALPPGMPVMVNFDANTAIEDQWLIDNVEVVAIKYGMFSHGYHVSDGIQRLADFRDLQARVLAAGKPMLTHGEQDAEIFRHAWGHRNLAQAIYWGGLYATHNPIDVWNVPRELLQNTGTWETYRFFNRFAGVHDPANSPRAFIALREGLNAADATRFPVIPYGTVTKSNEARYVAIAKAYAAYGARMEDPTAATGGGIRNRQREGYNDAGWNILPGNYSRFMEQIDPGSGDVGWWHVDVVKKGSSYGEASPYSRFARGFEFASEKNAMHFDLDDALFRNDDLSLGVRLKVIYFDEHAGSTWELQYDNGSFETPALRVTNTGSGTWKTIHTIVYDAAFTNGGTAGADLSLVNTDALDDIFHLIDVELEKAPEFTSDLFLRNGARVGQVFNDSLQGEAEDPNGDPLQFEIIAGPSWLVISPEGKLSGTPGPGDVGLNEWVVQVADDGSHVATADLVMVVNSRSGGAAPTFSLDLFSLSSGAVGWGYDKSIAAGVVDPQGDPLSFSVFSGPSWLSVEPDGRVLGLPDGAAVGLNFWCVKVEDSGGNAGYALATIDIIPEDTAVPPADPLHFAADFSGSTPNPNPFSNSSPISFGGLDNLNRGTMAGSWDALAEEASSVYPNAEGDAVLFAGTGAFNLRAVLRDQARFEDAVEVSLDFALCRIGSSATRRTFVSGLDPSGSVVFRVLLSGYAADDGGRTLYLEDRTGNLRLLASGLGRSADNTFSDTLMDSLVLNLDSTGFAVTYNGAVRASAVPFYSAGVSRLAALRFEGDSSFFDNISVVSRRLPGSENQYALWAEAYALVGGPEGDDDLDGFFNLLEFGQGGVPIDASDAGYLPILEGGSGRIRFTHAFRGGVHYELEWSETMEAGSWSPASSTVERVQSLDAVYGRATYRTDLPVSEKRFLRLRLRL